MKVTRKDDRHAMMRRLRELQDSLFDHRIRRADPYRRAGLLDGGGLPWAIAVAST